MLPLIPEIFPDGGSCVRSDKLHRCGVRSVSSYYHCVLHRAVIFKRLDDRHYSGCLLTDRHVNAFHVTALLVNDRVNRYGGFPGLPVADYQLPLASSDRDHRIDRFYSGGKRFLHRLSRDDARRLFFYRQCCFRGYTAFSIEGLTDRIYHSSHHLFPNTDFDYLAGPFCSVTFLDLSVVTEKNYTYIVRFKIQRHTEYAAGKFYQLGSHCLFEPHYTGDTVTYHNNFAYFVNVDGYLEILDLFF